MTEAPHWAGQSPVTDPGTTKPAFDDLPDDLAGLQRASQQLVFHYRGGGDWAEAGLAPERIREVDTRYVEDMCRLLLDLQPSLAGSRAASRRVVGCCRDYTVLLVAMARHKGIPARARVGFATYFDPDWILDHVVAEVWDEDEGRWRLVEAQVGREFEPVDGPRFDVLDVPRDRFITAPKAWLEARAGVREAERFVVGPDVDVPDTKGWPYLRHTLVHDLAALAKTEMVLWDEWGVMTGPPIRISNATHARHHLELLDHLARLLADPGCPVENIDEWAHRDGFAVPGSVTSFSPASPEPLTVDVTRALGDGQPGAVGAS
jgi:hypothetical protein